MYKKLQEGINAAGVQFAVHTGDVKAGSASCGASSYKRFKDLSAFNVPSLLTPGDNGWTDCHRLNNGNYDPLERLDFMRSEFFNENGGSVMGAGSLNIDVQDGYPENQMFTLGNTMWVLVHVVGSNNALYDGIDADCDPYLAVIDPGCEESTAEYLARNAAGNEFVSKAFEEAKNEDSDVIFIVIQANIFSGPCGTSGDNPPPACEEDQYGCGCCDITQPVLIQSGFVNFWDNLVAEANDFDGPVYLVHGDSHYYQIFPNPTGDADNLVALQVPGSDDIGWVEATIDGFDVSFVMIDNRPDFDYYEKCPDSPNLQLLEIAEDFPPACESIGTLTKKITTHVKIWLSYRNPYTLTHYRVASLSERKLLLRVVRTDSKRSVKPLWRQVLMKPLPPAHSLSLLLPTMRLQPCPTISWRTFWQTLTL